MYEASLTNPFDTQDLGETAEQVANTPDQGIVIYLLCDVFLLHNVLSATCVPSIITFVLQSLFP